MTTRPTNLAPISGPDALDDLIFSWILDRQDELAASAEAAADAGFPGQDELDVVRTLVRLILSAFAIAPGRFARWAGPCGGFLRSLKPALN
jgi:hypothetical protein